MTSHKSLGGDIGDINQPHDTCFPPPAQTTVTIVGSVSARHSECVVKNADTGKLLCQGRSQMNRTCACNIPSRPSYSRWTPLGIVTKSRSKSTLLSSVPGDQHSYPVLALPLPLVPTWVFTTAPCPVSTPAPHSQIWLGESRIHRLGEPRKAGHH